VCAVSKEKAVQQNARFGIRVGFWMYEVIFALGHCVLFLCEAGGIVIVFSF